MIYHHRPDDFSKKFDVASCFVEHDGQILLLHRQPHKPQGNRWGLPAGKIESGEDRLVGLCREIKEETGLEIDPESLTSIDRFYVQYPEYDFVYYMHHAPISKQPIVSLNPEEHQDYKWITPIRALEENLVLDEDFCITHFYNL